MARNYKQEWEKEKETKTTRLIKIDKELFEEFSQQLSEDKKTLNGFVVEQIKKYLKKI